MNGPAKTWTTTLRAPAVGRSALAAGLLLLAGCAGLSGQSSVEASAVPAAPMDAVAAFAARAVPGDQDRVVLSTGQTGMVRLARAWNAASGRQCREVQLADGRQVLSRIYCQDGARWVATRPLLLGSQPLLASTAAPPPQVPLVGDPAPVRRAAAPPATRPAARRATPAAPRS